MASKTQRLKTSTTVLGRHPARVMATVSHLISKSRTTISSVLSYKLTATYASFTCSSVLSCLRWGNTSLQMKMANRLLQSLKSYFSRPMNSAKWAWMISFSETQSSNRWLIKRRKMLTVQCMITIRVAQSRAACVYQETERVGNWPVDLVWLAFTRRRKSASLLVSVARDPKPRPAEVVASRRKLPIVMILLSPWSACILSILAEVQSLVAWQLQQRPNPRRKKQFLVFHSVKIS